MPLRLSTFGHAPLNIKNTSETKMPQLHSTTLSIHVYVWLRLRASPGHKYMPANQRCSRLATFGLCISLRLNTFAQHCGEQVENFQNVNDFLLRLVEKTPVPEFLGQAHIYIYIYIYIYISGYIEGYIALYKINMGI